MAGPIITIQAPERRARRGGISKVATVRPNERIAIGQEVVFQSNGCEFPKTEINRCFAEAEVPDKTFDAIGIDSAVGEAFTVFAGVQCHVAPDPDELERAERQLSEGVDRVLEDALETYGIAGTALAAGGTVAGAIARVDQEIDDKYIGEGVILMSRFDAVMADAAGALQYPKGEDGIPTTINGTPVLASGRVAPGTVYGFGAIVIEHTAVTSTEAIDHTSNKHYAVAEAQYLLAVDCEFRVKSAAAA